ncbi:hypothetical protein QHF83_53085 [Polyangium sp. 15x6]|nr:hypothetical protein [Polyangium sp. 15x6]
MITHHTRGRSSARRIPPCALGAVVLDGADFLTRSPRTAQPSAVVLGAVVLGAVVLGAVVLDGVAHGRLPEARHSTGHPLP